jgi:hypothetical protein
MLFCDLGNGDCVSDVSCNEIPDAGSGCSAGSIAASSYDQACEADADCAPIYAGSLCGDCFCPNATIASSALAQYDADFAAAGTGPNACFCPDFPPPTCVAGVCTPN